MLQHFLLLQRLQGNVQVTTGGVHATPAIHRDVAAATVTNIPPAAPNATPAAQHVAATAATDVPPAAPTATSTPAAQAAPIPNVSAPGPSNAFTVLNRAAANDTPAYKLTGTKASQFYYDCMTKHGGEFPPCFNPDKKLNKADKLKASLCLDLYRAMQTSEESKIMLPPSVSESRSMSAHDTAQLEVRRRKIVLTLTELLASKLVHEFLSMAERQPADERPTLPAGMREAPKLQAGKFLVTSFASKLTNQVTGPLLRHLREPLLRREEFQQWRALDPSHWKQPPPAAATGRRPGPPRAAS